MTATLRFGPLSKARLATSAWLWLIRVRLSLRRQALPDVVRRLGSTAETRRAKWAPGRLGRAVQRALWVGPFKPRCLVTALVHYRLLCEQGERPELVIGLPIERRGADAHAWVEVDGRDVGPPPGRAGHEVLARYG